MWESRFPFKSGDRFAVKDKATFESWKQGQVYANTAIRLLMNNNEWKEGPSSKEFIMMAYSLGYTRDGYDYDYIRKELKKLCRN